MSPATEENEKFTVPLADGSTVESVFYGTGTLCLSCQVGCAVGCPYCASGSRGLIRNLLPQELVGQIEQARRKGFTPSRLTISGIGEPLHNAENVKAFMRFCQGHGLPISLTTTGHPLSRLREFLSLQHNGLMISLHAGSAATHRRLVPGGPDFEKLWEILYQNMAAQSRRNRRKLGINYLLLKGINDSGAEISLLAKRMQGLSEGTVHLLICNPLPGTPFRSPDETTIDSIHAFLRRQGVNVRRANSWRRQSKGGCGTLFAKALSSPFLEIPPRLC